MVGAMDASSKSRGDSVKLWVWDHQDDYDDWINRLLRDTPESWESSEGAAEDIITAYVRHLEQRVMDAYGNDGLDPNHEGVAEMVTAVQEMNTIRDWIKTNLPQVDTSGGVAKPTLALLALTQTSVTSIVPVLRSIISVLEPQFWALGLTDRK